MFSNCSAGVLERQPRADAAASVLERQPMAAAAASVLERQPRAAAAAPVLERQPRAAAAAPVDYVVLPELRQEPCTAELLFRSRSRNIVANLAIFA